MEKLESTVARHILQHCPSRTDKALQERFGISYNTLRKIEGGQPIRRSLALRLADRLAPEIEAMA